MWVLSNMVMLMTGSILFQRGTGTSAALITGKSLNDEPHVPHEPEVIRIDARLRDHQAGVIVPLNILTLPSSNPQVPRLKSMDSR